MDPENRSNRDFERQNKYLKGQDARRDVQLMHPGLSDAHAGHLKPGESIPMTTTLARAPAALCGPESGLNRFLPDLRLHRSGTPAAHGRKAGQAQAHEGKDAGFGNLPYPDDDGGTIHFDSLIVVRNQRKTIFARGIRIERAEGRRSQEAWQSDVKEIHAHVPGILNRNAKVGSRQTDLSVAALVRANAWIKIIYEPVIV